jgi:ADP-ribose pyrophosphatase
MHDANPAQSHGPERRRIPRKDWQVLSSEELCRTPHLTVRRETIASALRPHGRPWLVVERKPAVVIVPRTPEGEFVLVRQERPAVRELLHEFPAGQIDLEASEAEEETTARRELREETGFICPGPLFRLGSFFSSPGFTNERETIFLAEGVVVADEVPLGDPAGCDEAIAGLAFLSPESLTRWVAEGRIRDANSLVAFALLKAREIL